MDHQRSTSLKCRLNTSYKSTRKIRRILQHEKTITATPVDMPLLPSSTNHNQIPLVNINSNINTSALTPIPIHLNNVQLKQNDNKKSTLLENVIKNKFISLYFVSLYLI